MSNKDPEGSKEFDEAYDEYRSGQETEESLGLEKPTFGELSTREDVATAKRIFGRLVNERGYTVDTHPALAHTIVSAVILFPGHELQGTFTLQEMKSAGDMDSGSFVDELDEELIEQYMVATDRLGISDIEVLQIARALRIRPDVRGNDLLKLLTYKLSSVHELSESVKFELGLTTLDEIRAIDELHEAESWQENPAEASAEDYETMHGDEDDIKGKKDKAPDHKITL